MKKVILIASIVFLLAGCAPTAEQVREAIQQTQAAAPNDTDVPATSTTEPTETNVPTATKTKRPTNTPAPTKTARPTITSTATASVEDTRKELEEVIRLTLETLPEVEAVNMVRIIDNVTEVEFRTVYVSQSHQPDVTYSFLQIISGLYSPGAKPEIAAALGGDAAILRTTSYSSSGDYRYQSENNSETLTQLDGKRISMEEWIAAANAGFR